MSKTRVISIIVLVLLVAAGAGYYWSQEYAGDARLAPNTLDENSAESVVSAFGKKLQMVSLAAPKDVAARSIAQNYGAYVAPALLAQWESNPSEAPGRLTSSPWPDRIDITSTVKNADGTYTVHGDVVEITSEEIAHGGAADTYPVTLTLAAKNNVWLVTGFQKN